MKYKKGDKFIITLGREISDACMGRRFLVNNAFFLCEDSLDALEPYEDQKRGAYQRGLADAWAAAEKVASLEGSVQVDLFGSYMDKQVFRNYTAEEAIEKLRAYEEAQEIHVGDEVESCRGRWVVCKTDGVLAYGLDTEWVKHIEELSKLEKTGRNFPEVAALLDKLKGDAPDV